MQPHPRETFLRAAITQPDLLCYNLHSGQTHTPLIPGNVRSTGPMKNNREKHPSARLLSLLCRLAFSLLWTSAAFGQAHLEELTVRHSTLDGDTSRTQIGIGESMRLWVDRPAHGASTTAPTDNPDESDAMAGVAWGIATGGGTLIPSTGSAVILAADLASYQYDLSISAYIPHFGSAPASKPSENYQAPLMSDHTNSLVDAQAVKRVFLDPAQSPAQAAEYLEKVLSYHPAPQAQGPILFEAAVGLANRVDKAPAQYVQFAPRAIDKQSDYANRALLRIYWGDSLQFQAGALKGLPMSAARTAVAEQYILALKEVDGPQLPDLPVPLPGVDKFDVDPGGPAMIQLQNKHAAQMKAHEEAKAINLRLLYRDAAVGQLVAIYSLRPYNTVELELQALKSLSPHMASYTIQAVRKAVADRFASQGGHEVSQLTSAQASSQPSPEKNLASPSSDLQIVPAPVAAPSSNPNADPSPLAGSQSPASWPYLVAAGLAVVATAVTAVYLKRRKKNSAA
jgi:hypothetical protein